MEITHIDHIGIAVKSIDEHLKYYEGMLGLKCYSVETVEDQKVKTAFIKIGQTKIELLEPTCQESTIAKYIEKKGEGIHHIAYGVKGIEGCLYELADKGVRLIDNKPRPGAEGLNIAFLHPKSTGSVLTELCEHP